MDCRDTPETLSYSYRRTDTADTKSHTHTHTHNSTKAETNGLYTDENTKQQKNEKGFDESGIIVVAVAILRRTVYSRRVAHHAQ